MTCEPFCDLCGGNLGHPANGDWTCAKCKRAQPAPSRWPRRNLDLASPLRFEPTVKRLGDIVISGGMNYAV